MSRKPIDQQQPSECRQAIWDEIKLTIAAKNTGMDGEAPALDVDTFTAKELDVKLDASSIREYLSALCKAGYLELVSGSKRGESNTYRLVNDCGAEAPRLRKDGSPVTQGQGRLQMWNAMRIIKQFTAVDLAFNASTDEHSVAIGEATAYCQTLDKAGYLIKNGHLYRLLPAMWTGPQPPQIQRTRQVYDPNLKRVVWSKVEGGAE